MSGLSHAQMRFIKKYESQYLRDRLLRPTDTLMFIPSVMNLVENKRYDRLLVSEKRRCFFQLICHGPLKLEYPSALDIVNKTVFQNPRGDLDYWYHKRNKIHLYKSDPSFYHPRYATFINALIDYVNREHPDHIFTISNVVYTPGFLLWAIKRNEVYAIVYTDEEDTIIEYKADAFVMRIAPDSIFDPLAAVLPAM